MWPLARIRRWLHSHKIEKLHRHHRVQNSDAYVEIDAILARFRSAGGLKHDFQPHKLFQLRQLLERYRAGHDAGIRVWIEHSGVCRACP